MKRTLANKSPGIWSLGFDSLRASPYSPFRRGSPQQKQQPPSTLNTSYVFMPVSMHFTQAPHSHQNTPFHETDARSHPDLINAFPGVKSAQSINTAETDHLSNASYPTHDKPFETIFQFFFENQNQLPEDAEGLLFPIQLLRQFVLTTRSNFYKSDTSPPEPIPFDPDNSHCLSLFREICAASHRVDMNRLDSTDLPQLYKDHYSSAHSLEDFFVAFAIEQLLIDLKIDGLEESHWKEFMTPSQVNARGNQLDELFEFGVLLLDSVDNLELVSNWIQAPIPKDSSYDNSQYKDLIDLLTDTDNEQYSQACHNLILHFIDSLAYLGSPKMDTSS